MRISSKLLVATAAAGLVATGGSAFTATSTLNAADKDIHVGSVSQGISGATLLDVTHSYTPGTDTTDTVTVKVDQWLDTTVGVLKVNVTDEAGATTTKSCDGAVITDALTDNLDAGEQDYSTVACTINVAKVKTLQFVVNG
jgi:ABC-type glycerol-3-phosphate transport system substrate-binding protein